MEAEATGVTSSHTRLASYQVRRSGLGTRVQHRGHGKAQVETEGGSLNPASALGEFLAWAEDSQREARLPKFSVDAVGHRIVHGGAKLRTPVLINDAVLAELDQVTPLAPLHNPPTIAGIVAARELFGAGTPNVAVFDTAFHSTLPSEAATYAIPADVSERYGIRRYGFHGIAHECMVQSYVAASGRALTNSKLITLQLGQGCSAAAVKNGQSVDTSMGFTPLEGLMMGTRPGDLDPGILPFLTRSGALSPVHIEPWLSEECGLLGVSKLSSDLQELWSARKTSEQAALAINMFCYRIRKYLGAFLAVLGGADAIMFGGGIGENQPGIRSAVCQGMEWSGISLDEATNGATVGTTGLISAPNSAVEVWVTPVDESSLIARKTFALLQPG